MVTALPLGVTETREGVALGVFFFDEFRLGATLPVGVFNVFGVLISFAAFGVLTVLADFGVLTPVGVCDVRGVLAFFDPLAVLGVFGTVGVLAGVFVLESFPYNAVSEFVDSISVAIEVERGVRVEEMAETLGFAGVYGLGC